MIKNENQKKAVLHVNSSRNDIKNYVYEKIKKVYESGYEKGQKDAFDIFSFEEIE